MCVIIRARGAANGIGPAKRRSVHRRSARCCVGVVDHGRAATDDNHAVTPAPNLLARVSRLAASSLAICLACSVLRARTSGVAPASAIPQVIQHTPHRHRRGIVEDHGRPRPCSDDSARCPAWARRSRRLFTNESSDWHRLLIEIKPASQQLVATLADRYAGRQRISGKQRTEETGVHIVRFCEIATARTLPRSSRQGEAVVKKASEPEPLPHLWERRQRYGASRAGCRRMSMTWSLVIRPILLRCVRASMLPC